MKIAIIGAGAMGGAIVEGLLKAGHEGTDICVSDPSAAVLDRFATKGTSVTTDNEKAAMGADVVCVVVKPWLVESVLKDIAHILADKMLIVVAAGVPSAKIMEWIGQRPLFLCIPNIAIAQLQSMTFLVPCGAVSQHQIQLVTALFNEMGQTIVTDEQHLSAGTTLASCGIAYAMRYVRAASEGGVELGFRADEAKQIVMQTMLGAVKLLEASGMHPEQAIDLVATPGGLTIKGLNEMEHAGFTSSVIRGLKAAVK